MNNKTKEAFSEAEWEALIHAPFAVGMVVITADMNIPGLLDEGKALYDAIDTQAVPESVENLIAAVKREIHELPDDAYQIPAQVDAAHPDEQENLLLEKLRDVRVILDAKLNLKESEDFKNWLFSIAASVSKASTEGGFLGIGSETVSAKETRSLKEIAFSLGIDE